MSRISQNCHKIVLLFQKSLIVDQDKKERLILFDRPTQASTELVAILIALRSARQILKIGHSRELRVVIRVKQRAVVLVAAGARPQLHLCGASPERRIDVVCRYSDFLHHVGTRVYSRIRSVGVVVAPIICHQAVACSVDLTDRSTTEILYRRIECIQRRDYGRCCRHQIQNVAALTGQICKHGIRKYVSDRGGCGGKHRVGRDRYFDVLRGRRDLKREIQTDLLPLAQYYSVISRSLKS